MIRFQEVSYTYLSQEPGKEQSPSLDHISFHIPKGQCVVLCGKSGCGKTTLLRIVNGLACHFYRGRLEGDVSVSGMAPASASLPELARVVGSVFQNPRTQFFHTDTTGELAFQLENQNMPREQMRRCLDQVVSELRLEALMDRSIFALSGGEKQQIACGSVYASMPRVVVLDEPSSNLDLESIRKLQGLLETMKASGVTILVSEHRLWYLHGLADRYLLLENGKLRGDLAPVQMTALDSQARQAIGLRAANRRQLFSLCPQAQLVEQREPGLELHKFYYDGAQTPALNHVSFTVEPGQTVAFVGPSGGGKTTAASLIPRFWDVSSGTVLVGGVDVRDIDPHVLMDQIAFVFQNSRLFKASILENVRAAKPNASREEVLAALAAAQCGDILEKLPGYGHDDRHRGHLPVRR